ncbi:uncharacterized protein LOC134825175 [Bolinopsis microptera]|uniref:uncharacterized protein LOC134825175 n=1 Tax=Bolinopsis microptera TaxID=2820187 RepID=UPI0030792B35
MEKLLVRSWNMTEEENDPISQTVAAVIGSLLGTIGAVIVMYTSLISPVKAMSKRIIIMISIADVLQAFPTLVVTSLHLEYHIRDAESKKSMAWFDTPKACKIQSFLITTGAMLSFLWTFGLSQHMFLLVRFGIKVAYKAYLCLYVLSVIPFAINGLALHYDMLGADDLNNITSKDGTGHHLTTWCWIKVNNKTIHSPNFLERPCAASFWDGKAFEIFCYIGVTVYCMLARHYLNRRSGYDQMDSVEDESGNVDLTGRHAFAGASLQVNKILAIPLALIMVRMWGTVMRLTCYCGHPNSKICTSKLFIFIENFFDPLQGFVNCVLYKLSLGETCRCKCPSVLGDRGRLVRERPPNNSYQPVTVWVSPSNSMSSDY